MDYHGLKSEREVDLVRVQTIPLRSSGVRKSTGMGKWLEVGESGSFS